MTRSIRRGALLLLAMTIAATLQLGTASMASAATTCRNYDTFPADSGPVRNVRVCAAPASDFPSYSGWGRVVETYSVAANSCSYSLLPPNLDRTHISMACPALMEGPIHAWRWSGTAWSSVSNDALVPGSRAYFAPYAAGWQWAWTQQTGWVAIETKHAAYRWYA